MTRGHHDLARLGEFHRIADEVREHLPQPAGIAAQALGHAGLDERSELQPLAVRALGEQLHRALDHLLELEIDLLEDEHAGLDLREIEDVVDDGQQRVGAGGDGLGEVALARVQLGIEQQAGHADDAIHRRADLVAHIGQEFALQPRRLERGIAGAGDRLLGLAPGGDVDDRALEIEHLAAGSRTARACSEIQMTEPSWR